VGALCLLGRVSSESSSTSGQAVPMSTLLPSVLFHCLCVGRKKGENSHKDLGATHILPD
jgi:hypothetical protein